jgi:hypothetical protein
MSGKISTTTASASAKTGKKSSATASVFDELAALALANKEMEDEERAKAGSRNSFITLLKANSGALDKNSQAYIKGAKALEYAILSKKLRLGTKLTATIIGMFKVYAEVTRKERDSDMSTTVGFWMPEDAAQFPVAEGGIFDREIPNGNILQPCHWVFLYLHDNPDIEDGLIAFRSKGNSVYVALQKLVKAESSAVTELRFEITSQDVKNEKFKKTDYYPKFEVIARNYELTDEGKIVIPKGNGMDATTLKEILMRSNKVQKDYRKLKLVARRDVTALTGPAAHSALPGKSGVYEDGDEDEADHVSF